MIKKMVLTLGILTILLLAVPIAHAEGFPWRNHAPPFDALFGNHIDTHQQSQLMGVDQLEGFFYIKFTGDFQQGVPEAKHANCAQDASGCTVGWILKGVSMRARLEDKQPHQHPQWCVDPADLPRQPGFSHFHWLGSPEHAKDLIVGQEYDGYLLKLTARDRFFFDHHGGFLVTPGIDEVTHANILTDCP